MSDFLSKFNKDQYEETLTSKDAVKASKKKAGRTAPFEPRVQRVEHVESFDIDPTYRTRQRRKWALVSLVVLMLIGASVGTFYLLNQVKVPDFINQPVSELRTWANRNNITLTITETFSLEVARNYVIELDPLPNSTLQKGSNVEVLVSLGADPDEVIVVPDFTGQMSYQIQEWMNQNQIQNLRFIYEYNDTIASDGFVKLSFNDTSITNTTFRRKDYGVITISRGPIIYEKNIAVPDWITSPKMLSDAMSWATTNDVQLVVQREASNRLGIDAILRQAPSAGTLVAKKDKVTVVVSLGQSVKVPDFRQIAMADARNISLSNVALRVVEMYSDTNGLGDYIWQDVPAGTNVDQAALNPLNLTVYYSLGRPFITDLRGSMESVLPKTFYDFNQQGTKLTYYVTYVSTCSSGEATQKGQICDMSHYSQFVNVETTIYITVLDVDVVTP